MMDDTPAHLLYIEVLTIVGELTKADPPADSREGKLLVRLADAVQAYERAVYPMAWAWSPGQVTE